MWHVEAKTPSQSSESYSPEFARRVHSAFVRQAQETALPNIRVVPRFSCIISPSINPIALINHQVSSHPRAVPARSRGEDEEGSPSRPERAGAMASSSGGAAAGVAGADGAAGAAGAGVGGAGDCAGDGVGIGAGDTDFVVVAG